MESGGKAVAPQGSSRLGRILKAPYRALRRVRDLYVSSLTRYAERGNYRGFGGYPGPGGSSGVPRNFSFHPPSSITNSSRDDDLKDLVRLASQGRMGSLGNFHQRPPAKAAGSSVARSQSVAIGRIDEEKPCEFGPDLYAKSRSCDGVNNRARVGGFKPSIETRA